MTTQSVQNKSISQEASSSTTLPLGSIVALVTPMNSQGDIIWSEYESLIEWHIASKTQGIVVAGTTGECATFSIQEQAQIFKTAVDVAQGRLSVIAGTGSNCTSESIELTQAAMEAGASSTLTVVPYYNKPSQEGMYQHFIAQAEAADIPQIIYNVPGRCGADLSNDTLLRLAQHKNIVGLKDATGDLSRIHHLVSDLATAHLDQEFFLYSGDDMTSLAFMRLGGHGCISVTANVKPREMSQMCQFAVQGQWAKAAVIDQSLRFWHKNLFIESSPAPTKYVLWKLNKLENPDLRLPLVRLSNAYTKVFDQQLS